MGLLDLIRKKPNTAISKPQAPSLQQQVDRVYESTGKKIQDGLAKTTASTGTPIEELKGAAKFTTQMSNIGGGSKATGGGGMSEGLKTVVTHGQASTAKRMLEQSTRKKLKK